MAGGERLSKMLQHHVYLQKYDQFIATAVERLLWVSFVEYRGSSGWGNQMDEG